MEPSPGSWDPSSPRLSPPAASQLRAPTLSRCPAVARIPRAVTPARPDDVSTSSGPRRFSPARARSVGSPGWLSGGFCAPRRGVGSPRGGPGPRIPRSYPLPCSGGPTAVGAGRLKGGLGLEEVALQSLRGWRLQGT